MFANIFDRNEQVGFFGKIPMQEVSKVGHQNVIPNPSHF
jgi:hypothetical protein